MNDQERLAFIDGIYREVSEELAFLRQFNRQATMLALQRQQEQRTIDALRHLYQAPNL
jgi:hypothetical protein